MTESIQEEIAQLRAHINDLKQTLIDREGALAAVDEVLFVRRQQVDGLIYELAQREQILETILGSWFWRLTLPRRMAKRASVGVKRILRLDRNETTAAQPAPIGNIPISRRVRYVHRVTDRIDATKLDIKAIAFYVPGTGTAAGWIDVSNGLPRYLGHDQPRLADQLGFYDQSESRVLQKQVEIARQYGIYGFCFQHSWAGGKHELEKALRHFLADKSLDLRFCLSWMNEGRIGPDSDSAFMSPLIPVFSDPRYIRIDGKPVLIVSRPGLLSEPAAVLRRWREFAKTSGLPGLYIVAAMEREVPDARSLDFDAQVESPPYQYSLTDLTIQHALIDTEFKGRIHSYDELVENSLALAASSGVTFRTVLTGWDQEAVRPGAGDSLAGANTALFAKWLKQACEKTMSHRPEERLIFINAWNDWRDGAYLEPDRKTGYAYLHTASNVLRSYHNDPETQKRIDEINANFRRTHDAAIVFHCHYEDLIAPVFERYLSPVQDADLFITVRNDITRNAVEEVYRRFPRVFFVCAENRGRDLRPFLLAMRQLKSFGYRIACKVHSKKTPHSEIRTGDQWRQLLMGPLLGSPDCVTKVKRIFDAEPEVGLLAPEGSVLDLRIPHVHLRNTYWLDRLLYRMGRGDLVGKYDWEFAAGSMYWFRLSALQGLDDWLLEDDAFEPELGQLDGTLHHAVERIISLYAQGRGYKTKEVSFFDVQASENIPVLDREEPPPEDSRASWMSRPEFISESIGKQRALIRTLQSQLEKKERDLADETWVLEQLMKSWSWKVTTPLRAAASWARSLRAMLRSQSKSSPPGVVSVRTDRDEVESGVLKDLKALHTAPSRVDLQVFLSSGDTLNFEQSDAPQVSVVLTLGDRHDVALACLRSLQTAGSHLEVIMVNSLTSDEDRAFLKRIRGAHSAGSRDEAVTTARGEYILFLGAGIRQVMPGSLDAALSTMESSSDTGAVGGRIIHADGSLEEAGGIVWRDGSCLRYGKGDDPFAPPYMFRRDVDYVSSDFLFTRRSAFHKLGGFGDTFSTDYQDVDYCTRLWESGMRVVYDPRVVVLHEDPPSSKTTAALVVASQNAFRGKHGPHLSGQLPPHPNLIWKARSADRRRSILFLEDRIPHRWFGSGLPRTQVILEALLQHSFVTFYPLKAFEEAWSTAYADTPREVEVILNFGPGRLEEFLMQRREYYDTILVSRPHNMEVLLPILKKHPEWFEGVNVVYDAEALFANRDIGLRHLAGSPMSESEEAAVIRSEIELTRAADVVVCVSEPERDVFVRNGIPQTHVLGHAIQPDPTMRRFEDREGFLFVGAMRKGVPNVDAVIWFVEEILPLIRKDLGKDVSLTVAGVCESERVLSLGTNTVHILGAVDDLREYYDRARVFIAPSRYAAGIPLKVLEAAAHGLPSTVTPLLAAQLLWTDGCEVSVGGDTKCFAERCIRLYKQKEEWERLRKNGLERVEKECSIKAFQEKLASIIGARSS